MSARRGESQRVLLFSCPKRDIEKRKEKRKFCTVISSEAVLITHHLSEILLFLTLIFFFFLAVIPTSSNSRMEWLPNFLGFAWPDVIEASIERETPDLERIGPAQRPKRLPRA